MPPILEGEEDVTNTDYDYGYVHRYGAAGDGATDDTLAIEAAIAAFLVTGYPVRFLGKNYLLDRRDQGVQVMTAGVTLEGVGYTTKLFVTGDRHCLTIRGADNANRVQNVTIRNLRVTGKGRVESSTHPNSAHGITWTGPSGIEAFWANDLTIEKVWSEFHPYDGIGIPRACRRVRVVGCRVMEVYDDGINPGGVTPSAGQEVEDVEISGNIVGGDGTTADADDQPTIGARNVGIHLSGGSRNVRCFGNTAIDCRRAGIDFASHGGYVIEGNIIVVTRATLAGLTSDSIYGIRDRVGGVSVCRDVRVAGNIINLARANQTENGGNGAGTRGLSFGQFDNDLPIEGLIVADNHVSDTGDVEDAGFALGFDATHSTTPGALFHGNVFRDVATPTDTSLGRIFSDDVQCHNNTVAGHVSSGGTAACIQALGARIKLRDNPIDTNAPTDVSTSVASRQTLNFF